MRAHYSEFVKYCIGFYTEYPNPRFHTEAERKNWYSVDNALKKVSETDRSILLAVYKERTSAFVDTVSKTARSLTKKPNFVWAVIKRFERLVAQCRGLI